MSLRVWLPLNGDLQNLGLDDVTPVLMGTGITYTNGKIGKAATFPNSCSNCIHFPGYKYINNFSWTCWFKCVGQGSGAYQFILSEGRDVGNRGLNLILNKAGTTMTLSFMDISNSGYTATICNINLNIWYHVAITISKDLQLKVYLNGEQIYTIKIGALDYAQSNDRFVIGKMAYNYTSTTAYFPFNGLINDVRIYDHCLSSKEVKEISKGLVVHYPLNDMIGNENLIVDSKNMPLGSANPSTGTWRLAGTSNMTRTRVLITDSPMGECYGFQNTGIQTANDGSCYGIDSFPFEANTQYTISMYARIVNGSEGYAGYCIYSISSEDGGTHTKIDKNYRVTPLHSDGNWTRCVYTITTNSSTTRNIYIGITTGENSVTTQMCLIKIEKGFAATPWIPNPVDALYSELGLNDKIVYDCSGYGYNGTKTSTGISCSSDSPRYSSCMDFETSGYINAGTGGKVTDEITISGWVYENPWTADPHPWSCTQSGGWNIQNSNNKPIFPIYVDTVGYVHSISGDISTPLWTDLSPGWHLFTETYNGFNVKLYIDGELVANKATGKTDKLPIRYHATNSIFLHREATATGSTGSYTACKLSDFRIYATALSDEDIKELYETSASIDNHGNMWAYEIQEV